MTQATCPHCAFTGEVEAFFADDEGKRLAAVLAELPPEKSTAPALAEYKKSTAPALAEYKKSTAPALAEYKKVAAQAWAEYKKVAAQAWDECEKAMGKALFSALTREVTQVVAS